MLLAGGRRWVALASLNLLWPTATTPAQITVDKARHSLRLQDLQLAIGLGPNPGPKQREGDYYVCSKEMTAGWASAIPTSKTAGAAKLRA